MSTIHNNSALLGCRSALSDGTARCSTVRSITYSRHASASTASPIHSRRPARGTATDVVVITDLLTTFLAGGAGQPRVSRNQDPRSSFLLGPPTHRKLIGPPISIPL